MAKTVYEIQASFLVYGDQEGAIQRFREQMQKQEIPWDLVKVEKLDDEEAEHYSKKGWIIH